MQNEDKVKTSRASQTREKTTKKAVWTPPSSLDAPPAPAGFHHRWIRSETMRFDDLKNMAGRLSSGYVLVRGDEFSGSEYPLMTEGKYTGVIGVCGLLLARIPEEIVKARDDYFKKVTQDKDEAIESDLLKDQHPSMPINAERQTRVTFGGTKKD